MDLKSRRREVLTEMNELSARVQRQGRAFSKAERARLDELRREDDELRDQIERTPLPRRTDPDSGEPLSAADADQHRADPRRGFQTPKDFLLSVMHAGRSRPDARLRPLWVSGQGHQLTAGSDEHGSYSDAYGGFLIPRGFHPDLLTTRADADPLAGLTMQIPMDSPKVIVPARVDTNHATSVSGGLRFYRKAETQTASSSRMEMEAIELQATMLFGLAYATEEILTDSPRSFLAILEAGFAEEYSGTIANERLFGTGVGQYEGILNTDCKVTVAKETGQAADTILYENVLKMRARVWGYKQAVWLANHDTLPQLARLSLSVGTGGAPVWAPSVVPDVPDMLLGRPIYFTEYCDKLGDEGDIIAVNPSQYLEGIYEPLKSAESMHVRFVEHERTFKFWTRNAGRVWWRSALTPKNGAATLSPIVTLAARA